MADRRVLTKLFDLCCVATVAVFIAAHRFNPSNAGHTTPAELVASIGRRGTNGPTPGYAGGSRSCKRQKALPVRVSFTGAA